VTEAEAWIVERIPKDDDLDLGALTRLATDLGRQPRLWRDSIRHDPAGRV
jgi:hypothetical protein